MEEKITQEALNIMLADEEVKDNLKQSLDGVIENVSARAVSEHIKAKNGSGEPTSGTVEYKRFANAKIEDKGTARQRGAGNPLNAKPVKIFISDDKEITEEVQGKDVKLYGIDGVVERRKNNHSSAIARYLDTEFFKKVLDGTKIEFKSTVKETIDALIMEAKTLKNEFIDGIDPELLVLCVDAKYRKDLKNILDELPNGTDPKESAIGMYDSVITYEALRMPEGVRAVVMINGAIAQPYYVSEYTAEKVPFDDAVAIEDYLYKGTKAIMPDTIFYVQEETQDSSNSQESTEGEE